MKLTAEEYQRGILYWNVTGKLKIKTSSTLPGEPPQWSDWLTEPQGSLMQTPGHSDVHFDVKADGPVDQARPIQLRLERCEHGEIVTMIWEGPQMRPTYPLSRIPNHGTFHRLVVAVDALRWTEDAIIRHGDIVVRLITGKVIGETPVGIASEEIQERTMVVTSSTLETIEREGYFIEVVAPGETPQAAEQSCRAILGYVAVCLGENAIADVVFSEGTKATSEFQVWEAKLPPFSTRFRQHTTEQQVLDLDQRFSLILSPGAALSEIQTAYQVALRLYERGVRDSDPLDSFISFFFGVEALANAYADLYGPIPEKQEKRDRLTELIKRLPQPVDKDTRTWLRQELHRTTLAENFKFFVNKHDWEASLLEQFQGMKKLRDNISHGRLPNVELWQAEQAKGLLVRMLKAEFGLVTNDAKQHPVASEAPNAIPDLPPIDGDGIVNEEEETDDTTDHQ